MPKTTLAELLTLPAGERLELIEALWDSLDPHMVAMPNWHADILDRRDTDDAMDPGEPWEVVRARLETSS
jgi:putative addiction module component (TIGR02574 family)